jgi:SAM-dependent methyltransferase
MNAHQRYLQQAAWTHLMRSYLLDQTKFASAHRVLEVGCGTGAVLADLPSGAAAPLAAHGVRAASPENGAVHGRPSIYGLDISPTALGDCRKNAPVAILTCADALALPYPDRTFDITFCHFLVMWLKAPLQALKELKRVTRRAGHVLAFAEPDYTTRLDRPPSLVELGLLQNRALEQRGADIAIGSRLADLFKRAGLHLRETGTIETRPQADITPDEQEHEWQALEHDLQGRVAGEDILRFQLLDEEARRNGTRQLHVPTYFAWGQV